MAERRYPPVEASEGVGEDGKGWFVPRQQPAYSFNFFVYQYKATRGKNRRAAVANFADAFAVDGPTAEAMLTGRIPHRVEAGGGLVFTFPD